MSDLDFFGAASEQPTPQMVQMKPSTHLANILTPVATLLLGLGIGAHYGAKPAAVPTVAPPSLPVPAQSTVTKTSEDYIQAGINDLNSQLVDIDRQSGYTQSAATRPFAETQIREDVNDAVKSAADLYSQSPGRGDMQGFVGTLTLIKSAKGLDASERKAITAEIKQYNATRAPDGLFH